MSRITGFEFFSKEDLSRAESQYRYELESGRTSRRRALLDVLIEMSRRRQSVKEIAHEVFWSPRDETYSIPAADPGHGYVCKEDDAIPTLVKFYRVTEDDAVAIMEICKYEE